MDNKDSKQFKHCCLMNEYGEPGCDNYDQRRDLLQKIIDGQADNGEKEAYDKVINQCANCHCRQYCEQEIAIKNLLKTKLDRKRVPLDLVELIKSKIKQSA